MSDQKILIVDYDAKSLKNMADLFADYKLEIVTAADGQEAYEKFKSEKPDLILLEAMLPKLHGFDLAQKVYKETKGKIPVVIVTGLYKGTQYRNEAMRSFGAADYFEKPFESEKLIKSVLNLLHDEMDIQEDLPDPESVLKLLSDDDESKASSS
jgi:DNA-binding response OmpR family regulator